MSAKAKRSPFDKETERMAVTAGDRVKMRKVVDEFIEEFYAKAERHEQSTVRLTITAKGGKIVGKAADSEVTHNLCISEAW
jgi:hypothetical protein